MRALLSSVLVCGALIGIIAAVNSASRSNTQELLGPALTHVIERGNLVVTVVEQGTLESAENTEIKCKVRGENTIIWVIEPGTTVEEGEVLMRLDTLAIEDSINERSKYALWSQSGAEQAGANARRARLAIDEYLEGRFVVQKKTLEKELAVAEQNLITAENMLRHAQRMLKRGYTSQLEVEEKRYAFEQAKLAVEVKKTEIEVLTTFTKQQEVERLTGDWKAAKANQASLEERAKMDGTRRDLAVEEKEHCVIVAPKRGMVIYPTAKPWEKAPEIEEGATVHRSQTLLLMPDLQNMQIKVGIHESLIDQLAEGLVAKVTLPEMELQGTVTSIASVAQPAGWWTGNLVKYDTIVSLPGVPDLRPGMSAEVEIVMAQHDDVVMVPVAAVLETQTESLCWVKSGENYERRSIALGDSNDIFIVAESGLEEGEEVVLNPRSSIPEAREESQKTIEESEEKQDTQVQSDGAVEGSVEQEESEGNQSNESTGQALDGSDESLESDTKTESLEVAKAVTEVAAE